MSSACRVTVSKCHHPSAIQDTHSPIASAVADSYDGAMGDPTLPMVLTGAMVGAASAGALWAYSVFSPRCQFWAPVIRWLPQSDAVALTFEDGPHPQFTPRVLDALAAHQVKAAFFLIGRNVREHPALVRRIHREGHALGNHSLTHQPYSFGRDRAYWDRQFRDTQNLIADIAGEPPMFLRPPMGYKTRHIAAAARALGLPIVGWSVAAPSRFNGTAGQLAGYLLKRTTGHDILLLRDGQPPVGRRGTAERVADALVEVLDGIREKGLRAVGLVEALLAAGEDFRAARERTRARASS